MDLGETISSSACTPAPPAGTAGLWGHRGDQGPSHHTCVREQGRPHTRPRQGCAHGEGALTRAVWPEVFSEVALAAAPEGSKFGPWGAEGRTPTRKGRA